MRFYNKTAPPPDARRVVIGDAVYLLAAGCSTWREKKGPRGVRNLRVCSIDERALVEEVERLRALVAELSPKVAP